MKIPINLASQPFRRDRPILVGSAVVCLLLVATLGVLSSLILMDRAQLADVRTDVSRLDRSLRQAAAEQAALDAVLRQPDNAEVLERTVFLNGLLYRKGISWTKILVDLGHTLPPSFSRPSNPLRCSIRCPRPAAWRLRKPSRITARGSR